MFAIVTECGNMEMFPDVCATALTCFIVVVPTKALWRDNNKFKYLYNGSGLSNTKWISCSLDVNVNSLTAFA